MGGRVVARTRFPAGVRVPARHPRRDDDGAQPALGGGDRAAVLPEPDVDNRLVIGLGRHDLDAGLSVARSRLNLANVLDVAESHRLPTFVVGPPPGHAQDAERLAELSHAFSDVANRRRVPYVDTFSPLVTHEQWLADLAQSGNGFPGQAGYGLMAWLVLHTGWHAWLGLPDDTV